ncbi:DUF2398 family protein [Streptomyces nodosus]|uniref:DUF2398 family protein n=1 Tax=Streptomyces nodosus TaxID=40318 RepID=UPI003F51752D
MVDQWEPPPRRPYATGGYDHNRPSGRGTAARLGRSSREAHVGARISEAARRTRRHAPDLLPAPTAAERLAARAGRIDAALPARGLLAELSAPEEETAYEAADEEGETRYPFVTDSWLRGRLKEIISEYGKGFAADLREDPHRLLAQVLDLLAALSLVARVDGGVLVLPLLARYRGVSVRVKSRVPAPRPAAQTALIADDTVKDPTP